ncbi:MAG: 1-deoxy-D-xylulose-5-phosphate reductoisomerase [Candidatus Margulisiibacteriota bacterium]|nr:MAG: 1-deoxy-D-xylulose-5-phosphate reductoisomerase [Candidatus Margulisbacteria bacterium GWD2_39_127]OGI05556.1 MAG: 1-deoxy-D-xylulose-5-phosphate reductoisomerase [Candidatus Margulisbacteria bacterium GWF2_38_17]OGI08362.1 MAG: 1-deoxy-D-xylulose-5-phosphate reductoisomerase [Candidatus Margulisbacteria bacterium GWE2_39_32]PZM77333.1 MAG: 1-deoxy-D-xylulose-5-phosphate reductoisomerase [Candidatus Margulisiibacteriota bacterium]HAR63157.1 1-deoxy-D-xylulose-5-phosphate reductoisomeras
MKNIVILGSTGSIGTQSLEVVTHHPDKFNVVGLAAGSNAKLLLMQARQFNPEYICIQDRDQVDYLRQQLTGTTIKVLCGDEGLLTLVALPDAELVLVAIVGVRALLPTVSAIDAGKDIALASKEILVAAGHLVMERARKKGVRIVPVDSEHAAILQCLQGNDSKSVESITLTASGGPFFGLTKEELKSKKLCDALNHPNWDMGKKITVDSATLINKGLEVIEAHWLFGIDYDNINVVIHRESIIHSMVTYNDGSVIAQLGVPSMCLPIQYALSFPERLLSSWPRVDLVKLRALSFYEPDYEAFPCLKMAYEAGNQGGSAPTVLNGANEEAVKLFLQEKIGFLEIPRIISLMLEKHAYNPNPSLEDIVAIDKETREKVNEISHGKRSAIS